MSFDKQNKIFESASSWVIKTSQAKKIGYWKQAREIHRSPMQNWVTRAWRKNTKFVFGDKITTLKIDTHLNIKNKAHYSVKSLEHLYILDLLKNQKNDSLRKFVEKSLEQNKILFPIDMFYKKASHKILGKILFNHFTKSLFKYTGLDSLEIFCTLALFKKGKNMNIASLNRIQKTIT